MNSKPSHNQVDNPNVLAWAHDLNTNTAVGANPIILKVWLNALAEAIIADAQVNGLVENEPLASQDVAKKPTHTAPTSVNREEE